MESSPRPHEKTKTKFLQKNFESTVPFRLSSQNEKAWHLLGFFSFSLMFEGSSGYLAHDTNWFWSTLRLLWFMLLIFVWWFSTEFTRLRWFNHSTFEGPDPDQALTTTNERTCNDTWGRLDIDGHWPNSWQAGFCAIPVAGSLVLLYWIHIQSYPVRPSCSSVSIRALHRLACSYSFPALWSS